MTMIKWQTWDWPFFDDTHAALGKILMAWQQAHPDAHHADPHGMRDLCHAIAQDLTHAGLLGFAVPAPDASGRYRVDVRSVSLIREALAYVSPLADCVFAMQGIGTAALWLHGSEELRARYLAPCRAGRHIAAFALSEPDGGSDVAAIRTSAIPDGGDYVINGAKAWISNAGVADHYLVIARTGEAPGARGLSAFMVDADTPGLTISPNIDLISPHPIADLRFTDCRVPRSHMLGAPGQGFKIAMATLDIFRTSVGAAATGLARRALDETLQHVRGRKLFGTTMAEMDAIRMKLADMAVDVDNAALSTYRTAWLKDKRQGRATREVAMAKLTATEAAQRVIDAAVQLFGGQGLVSGSVVERLYRDIRPMRIYEGATEVQKLIIGRSLASSADRP